MIAQLVPNTKRPRLLRMDRQLWYNTGRETETSRNHFASQEDEKPTDQRVADLKKRAFDPDLLAKIFQFGRYMLVSSSREGSEPANLQGRWDEELLPNWGSKYTVNINTEMNYWPSEITNLTEMNEPLIQMVKLNLPHK